MKNKMISILMFVFAIFIVTFPSKYNAEAKWMTKSECESKGGRITKGPVDMYQTYEMVCATSHGTITVKSPNGKCPANTTFLGSSVKYKFVSKAESIDYRNYTKINSDLYCCEDNLVCKVKDGKYYGKSGSEVSKEQYLKECTNQQPTPAPEPEPEPDNTCIDTDKEVPTSCSINGTESDLGCGGEIKETALCGVIASSGNDSYETFSNNYCEIYCRREVKLTFEDKVKVLAGRYFKHSISKDQIQNLSAVITAKYECGGQIKYNTWKKDWKEANEALIDAWNEYAYWNTIVTLAPLKITEHPGMYCSSCASTTCTDVSWEPCSGGSGCTEDGKKTVTYFTAPGGGPEGPTTLYDYESKPTSHKEATCTSTCDFTSGSCTNPSSTISYNSKHQYSYHCGCDSGYQCTLKSGVDPRPFLAAAANAYNAALRRVNDLKKQIEDCNNEDNFFEETTLGRDVAACGGDGTTTGGYDENISYSKGYEVNIADVQGGKSGITKVCNESSDWGQFCGSCDADFSAGACSTETLVYYVCTGTPGQGECKNVSYNAPKNGAIMAYQTDSSGHYQSAKHYTQLFTGKVTNSQPDSSYLPMEDHTWPVAAERQPGTYDICYDIKIDDPKNRINGGQSTCDYIVVNELNSYDCDDGYHECYECPDGEDCYPDEDPDNPGDNPNYDYSLGLYFRSVDLKNLFPNSIYDPNVTNGVVSSREIGYNWKKSADVIEKIQDIDSVWTNDYLEFSLTLTPSAIRNIKQYNKTELDRGYTYLDNNLLNCTNTSLYCSSSFLSSRLEEYGVQDIYTNSSFSSKDFRYSKPGGDE